MCVASTGLRNAHMRIHSTKCMHVYTERITAEQTWNRRLFQYRRPAVSVVATRIFGSFVVAVTTPRRSKDDASTSMLIINGSEYQNAEMIYCCLLSWSGKSVNSRTRPSLGERLLGRMTFYLMRDARKESIFKQTIKTEFQTDEHGVIEKKPIFTFTSM